MNARSASWSPPVEARRAAGAAAVGIALLAASWALLHGGFFDDRPIVDTPVYQTYGDAVLAGKVPYRDFGLEYPPGALPAFVLPALAAADRYETVFGLAMLACGGCAIAFLALSLTALEATPARLYGAVAFAGLTPLALGPVVLTRFDLWPAALGAAALAAFLGGRERIGFAVLALAVSAKLYPVVLLPLALLFAARRRGAREAAAGLAAFAAVVVAVFLPFALAGPAGLVDSFERQAGRPLQIESLGSGFLLAADRLGAYAAAVVSSHGSQNLVGALPDLLASVQTGVQAVAVAAVWLVFARGPRGREELVLGAAAAVVAFAAFGKVLSPQFLIWLLPLVPLVGGRAGLGAGSLLAAALVLTQLWFPTRYWSVVALQPVGWLVLARDLVLVALFALLLRTLAARRPGPAASRSA